MKYPIHRGFYIFPEITRYYKITVDQYLIFESIRHLSSAVPKFHWCVASKGNIADYCVVGRATVFRAIERGIDLGILEKHPNNFWYQTTKDWNSVIEAAKGGNL